MGFLKKIFGRSKTEDVDEAIKDRKNDTTYTKRTAPADKSIRIDSDRSVKISSNTRLSVPEDAASSREINRKAAAVVVKSGNAGGTGQREACGSSAKPTVGNTSAASGGYFDIKKSKDDRYVFNLYARNHTIIATSQIYASISAAQNGIESVRKNAPSAPIEDQTTKEQTTLPYPKWEIYKDGGGQFRFRLNASNGSCICHSQGYKKKSSCKNGIESIKRFAPNAEIKKSYLKKAT